MIGPFLLNCEPTIIKSFVESTTGLKYVFGTVLYLGARYLTLTYSTLWQSIEKRNRLKVLPYLYCVDAHTPMKQASGCFLSTLGKVP